MAKDDFEIGNKAAELIKHTILITSNKKRYPPKYKTLIERIQRLSLDIYEFVIDANRTNLNNFRMERQRLQTKAITSCDKLSKLCELSIEYVKIVDSALKAYDKEQKDIVRLAEESKAEQERIKRKRAKRQAYKERRTAEREQEERDKQIAIQREVYIQAMKYMEDSGNVANN